MPIQFFNLLQDTWNFIRNRPHFVLSALLLLTGLQLVIEIFFPRITLNLAEMQSSPELLGQMFQAVLFPALLSLLATTFVTVLLILNIRAINEGTYHHFFQEIHQVIKLFLPITLLSFIQYLPLSFGISAVMMSQYGEISILALPLFIMGIYLFIKLILSVYVYLIETPRKTLLETLGFTWRLSKGKMLPLILFCLIIYIIPIFLSNFIVNFSAILGSGLQAFIAHLVGSILSLFITIFSFRFYQSYRQI